MWRGLKPGSSNADLVGVKECSNCGLAHLGRGTSGLVSPFRSLTPPRRTAAFRALQLSGEDNSPLSSKPISKKRIREMKRILEFSWELTNLPKEEDMPEEPLVDDCFVQFSALLDDRVQCRFLNLVPKYVKARTEIQTWSDYFFRKNGVRPRMADVDSTGIPWLRKRFRDYVLYRHLMEKAAKKYPRRAIQYANLRLTFRNYSTEEIEVSDDAAASELDNDVNFDFVDEWLMDYSMFTIQLDALSNMDPFDASHFQHGIDD